MKHLYLSEDGKQYNTKEEALKADEAFLKAKEDESKKEAEKKALVSKEKKELADAVKSADDKVKEAEKSYQEARDKAAEILQKANEEAEDILKASLKDVDKAREERMLAIKAFNDKYGAYVSSYTGDKALEEYNRFVKNLNRSFNSFWNLLF